MSNWPGIKWNSREGINFLINFEFKWKQPAPKMSCFFLFFFSKLCWRNPAKASSMYQHWATTLHILEGSSYRFFGLLFKTYFKNRCFTKASVITKFFSDWFYMFKLNFQRLIWKMTSVYFIWFDYWTLNEWKPCFFLRDS